MMHDNFAKDGDHGMEIRWSNQQDETLTRNISQKMLNLPDSISRRKLHGHYQALKDIPTSQYLKHLRQILAAFNASDVQVIQTKDVFLSVFHGNVKSVSSSLKNQQSTNGDEGESVCPPKDFSWNWHYKGTSWFRRVPLRRCITGAFGAHSRVARGACNGNVMLDPLLQWPVLLQIHLIFLLSGGSSMCAVRPNPTGMSEPVLPSCCLDEIWLFSL
ncbi:hypothetical protein SAY86_023102 [Trapa natans]|uniref:Uncharacterized protein n=1 Tax=Trapa natans TaxID=22666 RepID=A0AAN7M6E8_TRANT|nr:hypothetical protein SAY86_023102 [Trapa natans]